MKIVVWNSCQSLVLAASLAASTAHADAADEPAAPAVEEAAAAPAKEPAAGPSADWRVDFTTWIWVMGLEGEIGVRGRSADVDSSFADIMEQSDSIFALSGRLEIGSGRMSAYVDGMYCDLGVDDASGPSGLIDVDVTFEQTTIDFGAMFRVVDVEPSGESAKNDRNFTLDLYGGGRYVNLDIEFDPANAASRSDSIDWIDPIVGARVTVPIAEHWHVSVNGDVGGFGVASDFTWSATAVVGYDFTLFDHPASVMAGYRAIGWDYTSNGSAQFEWDVIQHGAIIGFSMKF